MKKFILILFFLFSGEFIARVESIFDENLILKNNDKISRELPQFDSLNALLLLGDSYSGGYGIKNNERISTLLGRIPYYSLINLTTGGDNWVNYLKKIDQNLDKLKKNDIIIIGVTWGDVLFGKGELKKYFIKDSSPIEKGKYLINDKNQNHKYYSLTQKIYDNSKLIKFLIPNLLISLRRKGISLPIGNFHYLSKTAYSEKKEELSLALKHLQKVSNEYGTKVIIYLYPEFNFLNRQNYFNSYTSFYNTQIKSMQSILIIDGVDHFSGSEDGYYCLSVRDGHPNGLAHLKVADTLKKVIESN